MFENQLRQLVEHRRTRLIDHLKALSNQDNTPFEQLTLSELENEWRYYFQGQHNQAR